MPARGQKDLFDDPRFASDDLRAQHGDVLNEIMQTWCRQMTREEVMAAAEGAKLPAGPLSSPQEVLDDPHVHAMGYLKRMPFPGAPHDIPITETPFRLSKTPGVINTRAPMLGEHTEQILREIGFDAEQVADLRVRSII